MFDNSVYNPVNEDFVRLVQDQLIVSALREEFDVIIDNTHLVPQTVKKLHALVAAIGDVKVMEKCFNESVETCLARNDKREGVARVPDKTIKDMARGAGLDRGKKLHDKETYYPPRDMGGGPLVQDDSLPKAILCDLDGTLALIGDRSPYDASECDVKDKPNWPVIQTVLAMHAQGVKVIFMSGRTDNYRDQTVRFIEKWCLVPNEPDEPTGVRLVVPYELHMRSAGDMRKDAVIKQELFDAHVRDKYNVLFVLDDRNQVVDFWRSIGLTCFQVAPGAF
jgi:hypothetical protein